MHRRFLKEKRYPRAARRMGLQGKVIIVVGVDRTGRVVSVRIHASSGHSLLDEEAIRMAKAAKWDPIPSAPRKVTEFALPVRFRLDP